MTRPTPRRRRAIAAAAVAAAAALTLLPGVAPGSGPARAAVAATDACGTVLPKDDGTAWQCTFVDGFDGRSLDGTKWLVGDTSWSGFQVGSTCLRDSDRNVSVRNGQLHLTARREKKELTCASPAGDFTTRYTGGHVATRGRFAQTYGRFEVRASYPASQVPGLHAGFWMYPERHTYGAWPASGEIDVAEWWSVDPDLVLPSLHYPGRDFWADSGWGCAVPDVSAFHTYAVEWTPAEMRFLIDGRLCFRRSWTPDSPLVAPQPFDHPFNLVLTMGVGPAGGHNAVTSATELPASYVVDHVKAWR